MIVLVAALYLATGLFMESLGVESNAAYAFMGFCFGVGGTVIELNSGR